MGKAPSMPARKDNTSENGNTSPKAPAIDKFILV